jgi:BirA family biotin operon repressor/biotin-[acetyl-CoA-carboxylase] ligase
VSDSLAPDVLKPLLRGRFGHVYRYADSTDSTQRMLAEDESEGAVAVAEVQTEGRGRLGRAWEAPAGTSVLVSVLLLPAVEAPKLPELSLVAGGAVAQAIAEVTGLEPAIKVAGILAESSEGRVVLGIGVNVNQTLEQLPTGAKTEPTSLRLELGGPVSRAQVLAAILLQLERAYDAWVTGTSGSG